MLSGIYAPTSGDAQVYGRSVSTQMANIRGMIGNCFQHDVLYLELTVKQHVAMYARLKGIPHTEVDTKVNEKPFEDLKHCTSSLTKGVVKLAESMVDPKHKTF